MKIKPFLSTLLFWRKPKKHPDFPSLLSTAVIPKDVMPISEYRAFIDGLTDWRNCSYLLSAAMGKKWAVNIHIKDWYYTAIEHDSNLMRGTIRRKFIELQNAEKQKPLKTP